MTEEITSHVMHEYRNFPLKGMVWMSRRLYYRQRRVWWNPLTWFARWRLYSELFQEA